MQFFLTGFTPGAEFREFAFQGVDSARMRTDFTVKTDLSLIRKYGIRVQELPILCRQLLERLDEAAPERALTFTENEMRIHANSSASSLNTMQKGRPARKPRPGIKPISTPPEL